MLAAALPLAIVLALAGVLGKVRLILGQLYACLRGLGGRDVVRLGGLGVQTDRGAAHETCDCGGQSERLYGILHNDKPFIGWAARRARWALRIATRIVARGQSRPHIVELHRDVEHAWSACCCCRFEFHAPKRLQRNANR